MGFELFSKRRARGRAPSISLTKSGSINVNAAAYEEYFKDYSRVLLYYDGDRRVIGLKPTNEERMEAYDIHIRGTGATFSGVAFFKYLGLRFAETLTLSPVWNGGDGLVELSLPSPD